MTIEEMKKFLNQESAEMRNIVLSIDAAMQSLDKGLVELNEGLNRIDSMLKEDK